MDSMEVMPTDPEAVRLERAVREAKGAILLRHGDILTGNQASELALLVGGILLPHAKYIAFGILAEELDRQGLTAQAGAVRDAMKTIDEETPV